MYLHSSRPIDDIIENSGMCCINITTAINAMAVQFIPFKGWDFSYNFNAGVLLYFYVLQFCHAFWTTMQWQCNFNSLNMYISVLFCCHLITTIISFVECLSIKLYLPLRALWLANKVFVFDLYLYTSVCFASHW